MINVAPSPPAVSSRSQLPRVLLCADDYALTEGVSAAIEDLALARRLTATSAMVTTRHWPAHASRARALRAHLAIGLHFNLTLGSPLGDMPSTAPDGRFLPIGALTRKALLGAIHADEIAAELTRQLHAFESDIGHPPDFIDGHQHVHALPTIRAGVLIALRSRFQHPQRPLVRDPADRLHRILARANAPKAVILAGLSRGFATALRAAGFPTNDGFAGVTGFAPEATEADLSSALSAPGPRHLIMVHPGIPDAELASLDPVTDRRRVELELLLREGPLAERTLLISRAENAAPIDWRGLWEAEA